MSEPGNILLVEDEKGSRITLTVCLEDEGYRVRACETAKEAIDQIVSSTPVEVIISDLKLPDGSGLQVLWAVKKINPDVAFILITGHASLDTAIEAVNEGAYAYHVKPIDTGALTHSVRNAIRQHRLLVENKELLRKLEGANEELSMTVAELESKNRELDRRTSYAKTQILSTVTHELKTPLTSIIGNVDRMLLRQDRVGPLNDMQKTRLEIVQKNATRLRQLIDDILDVSIIESSSLTLGFAELDVREEIETVIEEMRDQVSAKEMHLELSVASDLPRVMSDRLRFSQVVGNLLSNSIKYSPPGSIITIAAKEEDEHARIDVSDTGIGISQENLSRLFTKFFRADNSLTREVSGTGLGLYIAKHIVEAHGGRIWVESEEGNGTTFSFTLATVSADEIGEDCTGPAKLGGRSARLAHGQAHNARR